MRRSSSLVSWCLIGLGVFVGCRIGYDELPFVGQNLAGGGGDGSGGADESGGTSGTQAVGGTSGTQGNGGEAGADSTGGASVSGGTGGATASGGSATGGTGGTSNRGGSGGSSATAGTSGAGGGTSGAGGSTSGAGGSTSGAGGSMSGAGGSMSGAGGSMSGAGGYAGASSLGDCQTLTFNAHSYVSCNVNLAWTTARDNCRSIGMELIRIDDAAENQWTHDNVYDTPPRNSVWIGASDITVEGEWRWSDGTLFWLGDFSGSPQNGLYANFFPQHPSAQGPTRDCGALDLGSNPGWFSNDCAVTLPYICESR